MIVKKSAIIYTGYEYQTLHGVGMLALWLNNPTAYNRICFEADHDDIPQGIDDIVLERQDGKIDYIQVKFTPSEYKEENSFIWDWLLKKTGKTDRARSILKKIFDAIQEVKIEKRGEITLLTNKIPDREIEGCLKDGKLNYDLIDFQIQAKIIEQLGDESLVRIFFEILQVKHTEKSYETLSREVKNELEKHSNDEGIFRLINRAGEWAKFKDHPSEGGWIELHHIREILSLKRAKPIPQSFYIPENYCLPDKEFHNLILEKITNSSGEIISITGDQGKGKSTYLSYLYQNLEEMDMPTIRHHYFLSINDKTHDRFNFRIVAESLLSQINANHKDVQISSTKAEDLNEGLKTCAEYYKAHGKTFILIIDGLDHVWRDNQGRDCKSNCVNPKI